MGKKLKLQEKAESFCWEPRDSGFPEVRYDPLPDGDYPWAYLGVVGKHGIQRKSDLALGPVEELHRFPTLDAGIAYAALVGVCVDDGGDYVWEFRRGAAYSRLGCNLPPEIRAIAHSDDSLEVTYAQLHVHHPK